MTAYEIFGWLYSVTAVAGGVLGVVFLTLLGRARSGNAPSLRFFASLFSSSFRFPFYLDYFQSPLSSKALFGSASRSRSSSFRWQPVRQRLFVTCEQKTVRTGSTDQR